MNKVILKVCLSISLLLSIQECLGQIAITEVLYDTAFDEQPATFMKGHTRNYYTFKDKAHHLGEYIELYNYTTEDIPLKGWFIYDNASKYNLPEDIVLKSQEYLIIAYRDLENKKDIGDYFSIFYPTVKNKRGKVIYQDYMILNNKKDDIALFTKSLAGIDLNREFLIDRVKWDNTGQQKSSNELRDKGYKSLNNRNFYVNSLQLEANGRYVEKSATPFTATYLPKTQRLLDIPIVQEALLENVAKYDWSAYVNELIMQICNLNISLVQQFPKGNYSKGELCFIHDAAGNYLRTEVCRTSKVMSTPIIKTNIIDEIEKKTIPKTISEYRDYIVVYPNPTSGKIKVSIDEVIRGKIVKTEVFSVTGASILSKEVEYKQMEVAIDITSYPVGVYILKFSLLTGESFSVNVIKK
ncbi:Lamin Tail Domain [Myroides sp. A21]|uniref:lamin tail domain-containing protein n=1 Tax=Myroides TaxID=76831 RepID=UPI00057D3F11|nr:MULTISPECIES: lamin tail domain-containing protein [Myroides]AJA68921.1 Lamin Tail Domain [Myroides sp. A21]MEC4034332.1 lamin tail domain-containing protein [Myroides odoratimimus]